MKIWQAMTYHNIIVGYLLRPMKRRWGKILKFLLLNNTAVELMIGFSKQQAYPQTILDATSFLTLVLFFRIPHTIVKLVLPKPICLCQKNQLDQLLTDICLGHHVNRHFHKGSGPTGTTSPSPFASGHPFSPQDQILFTLDSFGKETTPFVGTSDRQSEETRSHLDTLLAPPTATSNLSEEITKTTDTFSVTRADILDIFRNSFVTFLKRLPCYVREDISGPLIYYRVRLTEDASKRAAGRFRYPLQLDTSVARKIQFKGRLIPPFLEFDIEAEPAVSARRMTRKETHPPVLTQSLETTPRYKPPTFRRTPETRSDSKTPTQQLERSTERQTSETIRHGRTLIWQRYDFFGRKIRLPRREKDDPSCTLFRPVDRMRLLMDAISRYYSIDAMTAHGVMTDHFMLHQAGLKKKLLTEWAHFGNIKRLAHQPITSIREYFGESIAFYFAWLGLFTWKLTVPSFIGIIAFVAQLLLRKPYSRFNEITSNVIGILYGFYMTCWAVLFLKNWEHEEQRYRLEWGIEEYGRQRERQRVTHAIYNKPGNEKHNWKRRGLSLIASLVFITFVIAVVSSVFSLPYLARAYPDTFLPIREHIPIIMSLGNVTFIAIFDLIWCKAGYILTSFENWNYEADFQHSLIFKLFVFRFINYFNSFIYLAFVKNHLDPCPEGSCVHLLRWNLGLIFVSNFLFNFVEVGTPAARYYFQRFFTRRYPSSPRSQTTRVTPGSQDTTKQPKNASHRKNSTGSEVAGRQLPEKSWEIEYSMATYDAVYGIVEDYMEIVLLFAFVVLFSMILPIIPFLTVLSSAFEIRSDTVKLLGVHRRPYPAFATGIGPWKSMLHATCYIAFSVNIGISIFTMEPAKYLSLSFSQKLTVFTVAEHICFLIPVLLELFFPSETEEVAETREHMRMVLHEAIWGEDEVDEDMDNVYAEIPSGLREHLTTARESFPSRRLSM